MDALTRRQFDRAMFAKERTLAIRVGDYTSRDIKEASFEYGYIKGDTYKPGGTCAGSGKITFTSIITTFNKLDTLHPEIGLLVGDTYQWVKMGEYFINDIEIDRNRNTTTLELMDGMFKLNREYVTDLHFPAEVREVIQEICLKTGIELANDYFGISAMRYHVEQVPEGKKLSFRDMLSAMTQMIGMSCFFNREGKMEIRDLTESNITINADSYFLHGLTKSEIEYQIAGITCKTDKKPLTVGMKTGRSLELDNVFMTQSALNDLYYNLKNLTYYPYNLNYQGHLLLEVGQWVTIQTNKKETFKVPVLSQSFTFKGGLRGRISADSKAGNDTQYSYEGTITKQIKQQDGIEAKIQAQIEAADAAFDAEFTKREKAITDAIELAKAKAEEVKQEVSDTINQRFNSFHDEPLRESRRKAEEALRQAGASSSLAQEAKRIGLDSVARLEAFKSQTRSAQTALSGDLNLLKQTVTNDISSKQRQLKTDISKQVQALGQIKNDLAGVRSSQARYEETTKGRLTALTNRMEGKANKSEVRQTAETLTSQIDRIQEESSTRISTMTSRFNQRADALDAGVRRLTEGLRTKADISSLNVTAENIRQSVKSLETDTQNKLNQKLSQAEFEVQAGSIRQEILNATKDKADKTLIRAEAGKLREEFSNMQVGGRNYYRDSEKIQQSRFGFVFDNLDPYLSKSDIGTTWTLSFDCKLDEVDGSFPFHMSHGGANGFGIEGKKEFTATREWQRFRLTGPVFFKEDAPSESKLQMTLFNSDLGYGGTIFIRRIKLEKGTLATDWSPALEDTNGLITQAKASFERTAQELRTDLSAVQAYVAQDGQRQKSLQRYTREESARQARAVREQISRDYVGKSSYQEDVEGIHRRIEGVKTSANREITSQIASYRQSADGTFRDISSQITTYKQDMTRNIANLSHQLAGKVETTDFQRVKETSELYERILGNTENGIADKVARMAMTNQLFQVEVGKYSVSGPNLIKNSDFKNDTNKWVSTQNLGRLVKHSFYHNGQKDLMRLSNATKNKNFLSSHRFNLERNTDYVLNFRGFNNSALASYDVYILGRRAGESNGFTIFKKVVSSKKLSTSRCEDVSVTFNSGEMDNAYIRFENNGSSSGTADLYITEVDLYKGYKPRTWQPHPEDAVADANKKLEATQTKMTQLAGSWLVQNINSAGDLISGINLGANGHNRLSGKLTHITGETLIDRAVIKSAMVDKLKTANFESGSVTTAVLAAEAVTADKVKFDHAFIRKLIANDAFIGELTSKRIFATKIESVVNRSTFLEAYQGQIGGFTIGRFAQGRGRWISGVNQFSVGMGNGEGGSYNGENTAFWANWGYNWNSPGPNAWYVTTLGNMHCRNGANFHGRVDFSNSSRANFYGNTTFSRSPVFSNGIELGSKDVFGDGWNPKGGRNAVVWWNQVGSGSVKYWMEQKSDRRLKENITDTAVKALDKINRLRMVAFDFIESKKHEEIGLIAQEAETIVPRIVSRDPENPDGYLHIDYTALVPYLIKAIQELNQKIEKMENRHG
ncbi:tail fiber domain-containing protein [Streptococcus pseudopneumoniae]|uniref:tail fiber domain-containing protein n=1 Tax=Streptococcus pseudopneumoniae TaxID=257758 RepID=UPI0005E8699F|nr:tail fiber domain-containing protein [Streptococcus pseudopneumoniae]CIP27077.1 phage hyaluronidase [Streptococcus pseudopneumoniae]